MQRPRHRRFWISIGALAVLTVGLSLAWLSVHQKGVVVQDPAFHLSFWSMTAGTNHTMISGEEVLARLNDCLTAIGIHPVTGARIHKLKSPKQATMFGVGYRYDGGSKDSEMSATLVELGGASVPLRKRIHSTAAAAPGERLCIWLIPEEVTNLVAEVRLQIGGHDAATIRLR